VRFTPVVPGGDVRRDTRARDDAIAPISWAPEQEATPPDARPALPHDDRGGVDDISRPD
jgi:hypothetical protein